MSLLSITIQNKNDHTIKQHKNIQSLLNIKNNKNKLYDFMSLALIYYQQFNRNFFFNSHKKNRN